MITALASDLTSVLDFQLNLIGDSSYEQPFEIPSTTLFGAAVLQEARDHSDDLHRRIPQYGLLAGHSVNEEEIKPNGGNTLLIQDPRIFFNVTAPSSVFICGSQGSGKSNTLSCLLENCLVPSDAGNLANPLTGILFHYDAFMPDDGGSPCEAAFLSSNAAVRVRILCAPTNIRSIERTYRGLDVDIEALSFDEKDLNTKRMLDLMVVNQDEGPLPLYLHTVTRILRRMRRHQQESGTRFDYEMFKALIADANLTPAQLGPLEQRLDTLESFMSISEPSRKSKRPQKVRTKQGTSWSSEPGHLTIVDLSCPCLTPVDACSLFNIALGIFLEQGTSVGRVVALDEAHKFMNASVEATTFTNSLLSTIRLQRHLGVRVFISTQEPTISPALLDLSTLTIVHRFTSPDWLRSLKAHLAAAMTDAGEQAAKGTRNDMFSRIVSLGVGEALLFCPSAVLEPSGRNAVAQKHKLGAQYLKVHIRKRLTADGGRSVMAE